MLQNNLPPRVTHDEYIKIVKSRKRQSRVWGSIIGLSGILSILGVFTAIFVAPLGSYTRSVPTDLIVLTFIFFTGTVFCNYARYLWKQFPCRFCLKDNPEGATYCTHCGADMLSNETLPEHNFFFKE